MSNFMLPDETLLHVFSYLDQKDLCNVAKVSHNWASLGSDDTLWVKWAHEVFLMDEKKGKQEDSWKKTYQNMYTKWHDYLPCYTRVKAVWNALESWLAIHTPTVLNEIKPGATEADITKFKAVLHKADIDDCPIDMLCSLLIHDGQTKSGSHAGLFGGCEVYNYHINMRLLGVQAIEGLMNVLKRSAHQLPSWISQCVPVAGSFDMHSMCFIVMKDFTYEGQTLKKGAIVHHTDGFGFPIVQASSYCEWLELYAADLLKNKHDVAKNGEIIRFSALAEDGSDVTTNHVRVRANALFLPTRSDFSPSTGEGNFFFAYRIKISMDESAPVAASCQLRSRYWLIKDGDEEQDPVSGAGVIGEYPVMRPGTTFEYCSCCPLSKPFGSMEGYFQFISLETKSLFDVQVGKFALRATY